MNEKKFLQQMYGKLENQLEQEVKLADDSIEISEGDKAIFKIDSKGGIFYAAGKQYSNIVNKLHGKIMPMKRIRQNSRMLPNLKTNR